MAITAKSCSVLYLTVRVKADGGGGMSGGSGEVGRGRGDFKACFQNGIFSLNPHKEKTVITGSPALFLSSKRNARLGHFNNTNYARRCMYTAVGASNAIKQSREL